MNARPEQEMAVVPRGQGDPASASEEPEAMTRRGFEFALDLPPADVVRAFREHPDVEWTDGSPNPFPDVTGPRFQAWPRDETSFYVRVATGSSEATLSPVVMIDLEQKHHGSAVQGTFLKHPQRTRKYERLLKGTMWACAAFGALWLLMVGLMLAWDPLIGMTYLINITTILAPVAIALPFTVRNAPSKESMLKHGDLLWSLIGGVFVPHALGDGEAEDPFRERALGSGQQS